MAFVNKHVNRKITVPQENKTSCYFNMIGTYLTCLHVTKITKQDINVLDCMQRGTIEVFCHTFPMADIDKKQNDEYKGEKEL